MASRSAAEAGVTGGVWARAPSVRPSNKVRRDKVFTANPGFISLRRCGGILAVSRGGFECHLLVARGHKT